MFTLENFRNWLTTPNTLSLELPTLNDFRKEIWALPVQEAKPILKAALNDLKNPESEMSQLLSREHLIGGRPKEVLAFKLIFDYLYSDEILKKNPAAILQDDFERDDDFFVCIADFSLSTLNINPLQTSTDADSVILDKLTTIKSHFPRFLKNSSIKQVILADAILDPCSALHVGICRSTTGEYKTTGGQTEKILTRAQELINARYAKLLLLPKYKEIIESQQLDSTPSLSVKNMFTVDFNREPKSNSNSSCTLS